MPHVKVEAPSVEDKSKGYFPGYGTKIWIDGVQLVDTRDIKLSFGLDEVATVDVSMFVRAPFVFEADQVNVRAEIVVLPDFDLEETVVPGDTPTTWKRVYRAVPREQK